MPKAKNEIMQDKKYLQKLERLLKDEKYIRYSDHLMSFLKRTLNGEQYNLIGDIGCGTGFNSHLLQNSFPRANVVSVDYTQHNLDFGLQAGYVTTAILSSIYNLSSVIADKYGSNKFDMVFMGDIIEHLDNAPLALRNVRDSLSKQGVLVIHTPNVLYSRIFKTPHDPTHIHEFSPKELSDIVTQAGFTTDYFVPSGIPFLGKINPRISQKIAYTKMGALAFSYLHFLGPSMLLIARRK